MRRYGSGSGSGSGIELGRSRGCEVARSRIGLVFLSIDRSVEIGTRSVEGSVGSYKRLVLDRIGWNPDVICRSRSRLVLWSVGTWYEPVCERDSFFVGSIGRKVNRRVCFIGQSRGVRTVGMSHGTMSTEVQSLFATGLFLRSVVLGRKAIWTRFWLSEDRIRLVLRSVGRRVEMRTELVRFSWSVGRDPEVIGRSRSRLVLDRSVARSRDLKSDSYFDRLAGRKVDRFVRFVGRLRRDPAGTVRRRYRVRLRERLVLWFFDWSVGWNVVRSVGSKRGRNLFFDGSI